MLTHPFLFFCNSPVLGLTLKKEIPLLQPSLLLENYENSDCAIFNTFLIDKLMYAIMYFIENICVVYKYSLSS